MLDAYIIQKILEDQKKKQQQDDNRPRVYIDVYDIPLEEEPKKNEEETEIIIIQL